MQTFLPYPSFEESARCLDSRRLGKQRVEACQILQTLMNMSRRGWRSHPAVKMWSGYEEALALYRDVMIHEWIRRGYKNTMTTIFTTTDVPDIKLPPWIGDDRLHASHRSNLLRKDTGFYMIYGWEEPDNLPYFWPSKEKEYCHDEVPESRGAGERR